MLDHSSGVSCLWRMGIGWSREKVGGVSKRCLRGCSRRSCSVGEDLVIWSLGLKSLGLKHELLYFTIRVTPRQILDAVPFSSV
jgi:hypothetical protein